MAILQHNHKYNFFMKNVKKIVLGMGTSALCLCAVAIGHKAVDFNYGEGLLSENIEALTAKEIVVKTTWTCDGKSASDCSQSCSCGARINGTGALSGDHTCYTIEL